MNPVEVHFAGFELNSVDEANGKSSTKRYVKKLKIINISAEIQNMTVLPPQTDYFEIYYVKPVSPQKLLFCCLLILKASLICFKKNRLVPGFALEVQVIFKPTEYKYYSDSIKIFSEVRKFYFLFIFSATYDLSRLSQEDSTPELRRNCLGDYSELSFNENYIIRNCMSSSEKQI